MKQKNYKPLIAVLIVIIIALLAIDITVAINTTSNKKTYRSQGIQLYENHELDEAYQYFDAALAEKQWFSAYIDSDILRYQADICIQKKNYEKAISLIDQSREVADKKDLETLDHMEKIANALLLYENEQYEEAKAAFEELVSLGYDEYLYYVGNCQGKLGDEDAMLDTYRDFIAATGGNSIVYAEFAAYYLEKDDLTVAKGYIDTALNCNDEYVQRAKFLDIVYYEKKNELMDAYTKAAEYVEEYPDDEKGQAEYDFLSSRAAGLMKK